MPTTPYLLIDSSGVFPPGLDIESLCPKAHLIWSEKDLPTVTQELRTGGAFSAQSVLLKLSYPFQSAGLFGKAMDRWEMAMLQASGDTVQSVGDEWIQELRDAA